MVYRAPTKKPRRISAHRQLAFHQYRQLIEAVGHLVVYWSLIERQIDNWIMVAFHECGGDQLAERRVLPRQFKRKARFLRKCFRTLPPLQPYKDAALAILKEAALIADIRNPVVHGNIRGLKSDRGVYRFDVLDAKDCLLYTSPSPRDTR